MGVTLKLLKGLSAAHAVGPLIAVLTVRVFVKRARWNTADVIMSDSQSQLVNDELQVDIPLLTTKVNTHTRYVNNFVQSRGDGTLLNLTHTSFLSWHIRMFRTWLGGDIYSVQLPDPFF